VWRNASAELGYTNSKIQISNWMRSSRVVRAFEKISFLQRKVSGPDLVGFKIQAWTGIRYILDQKSRKTKLTWKGIESRSELLFTWSSTSSSISKQY
jgi:hypothetical protein